MDNMWSARLADTQLIPYYDRGIRLLCFTNIYTNYALIFALT